MATAEEKLPSSYSHVTLDEGCFPADRPAEHFLLQNSAPGNSGQVVPDTVAVGDCARSNAAEPWQHLHQVGFQPHRTSASGDPEKARISSIPVTDSKSDDHLSFPEDQSGRTTVPTVSFADQDQSQLHFYSSDQPPSYLGASADKPHHPPQLADDSPTPSTVSRDKIHSPSGSPEESTNTTALAYMTATPAAEASAGEASWDVVEPPSAADFAAAALQRPHRTSRPLPPPPSQRPAEQFPVVGQVQAAANIGLNNPHKVRRGESQ